MPYKYTDEQLNRLNQGSAVYSVNPQFAKRKNNRTDIVTDKPDSDLQTGEINTLDSPDGQQFKVIKTLSDSDTGFDGMAVAPIINGEPDLKNVAVVAAGTESKNTILCYTIRKL